MSDDRVERLTQTFVQVLEDFAMLFADAIEEEGPGEAPPALALVQIDFRGDGEGSLEMLAPEAISKEVASGFLGVDADSPEVEAMGLDALGELLNVTTGQVLTELTGTGTTFDLTPPMLKRGVPEEEWQAWVDGEETVGVLVDEIPVLLRLDVRDGDAFDGGGA